MKQTVIVNTTGLFPDKKTRSWQEINVSVGSPKENNFSCFPGYTFNTEPLWGSTVTEESPFTRSFDCFNDD